MAAEDGPRAKGVLKFRGSDFEHQLQAMRFCSHKGENCRLTAAGQTRPLTYYIFRKAS